MKGEQKAQRFSWLAILTTALGIALYGCASAAESTPTSAPESELVPTPASPATAIPTPNPTPKPSAVPVRAGEWINSARDLGWFTLEVSPDGTTVTLASVDFDVFKCLERGISGKWVPEGYTSQISNRKFALGGLVAGYMELSFSGVSPGSNPFPEVAFSGEFNTSGTGAGGTWNVKWDGISCSGTWVSSDVEEVPVVQAPAPEQYYVYPFCNCQEGIPAGQAPTLRWAWIAISEAYVADFIAASATTVTVDGQSYVGLEPYWGEIAYSSDDEGYKSQWAYELPALSPGEHRIGISVSLTREVTDSYDSDGDGRRDHFGPGEVFYGWVDVQLGATAASAPAGCPNGAPAGHWALTVIKSSPGDGAILIDGSGVAIQSGDNVIYLSADCSHAIQVGTTSLNYTGDECGENSVTVP
jgi:hypothetical protein